MVSQDQSRLSERRMGRPRQDFVELVSGFESRSRLGRGLNELRDRRRADSDISRPGFGIAFARG
jgi:hypothetical protein